MKELNLSEVTFLHLVEGYRKGKKGGRVNLVRKLRLANK